MDELIAEVKNVHKGPKKYLVFSSGDVDDLRGGGFVRAHRVRRRLRFPYFALVGKRFLVALSDGQTVLSRYGRSIVRKAS